MRWGGRTAQYCQCVNICQRGGQGSRSGWTGAVVDCSCIRSIREWSSAADGEIFCIISLLSEIMSRNQNGFLL